MPTEILMPSAGAGATEGAIARWIKRPGERVARGDVLLEVETDKALMEVEAPHDGVLGRIVVDDGAQGVQAGSLIGLLLAEGETLEASPAGAVEAAPARAAASIPSVRPAAAPAAGPAARRLAASPVARRIAAAMGVDLGAARGSGPRGRIVKSDVLQAAAHAAAGPAVPSAPAVAVAGAPTAPAAAVVVAGQGDWDEIPHTNARRVIAQRLSAAKQTIPHFYLTVDFDVDALLALRSQLDAQVHIKPSVTDFVVRAVALALARFPAINASWGDDAVRRHRSVDVSVAVATPAGLVTPVVRNADSKSVAAISAELADLAARARDGRLKLAEIQGGGFTVSNLGMYGVREFSAIINPPQSCILAVGSCEQRAVARDGSLAVATQMTCTLSADHRVVDGALGAEFLAALRGLVEAPLSLLA